MTRILFSDTSGLVAHYNIDDLYHEQAMEVFKKIGKGEIPLTCLFTTDYVFDEIVTFIECVLNRHDLAVSVGEALQMSPFTTIFRVGGTLSRGLE